MKKFIVFYFLFCFSFFSFFASGFMDSQDGLQYLTIARRIYYDHTIEMPKFDYSDRSNIHFNTIKASNGKTYSPTGIGYSLALIPAVAIEDVFLKIAGVDEIKAFPLQSDWPVLLFASMTNAFFGAVFVLSFYFYLKLLKVNHHNSLFLSSFLSVGSSILVYSKHTFAHMMFVSFMFLTFMLFKRYSITKKKRNLFLSGVSFGVTLISYNSTYLFVLPALSIYYLLLNVKNIKQLIKKIKNHILSGLVFLTGLLPFYLFNYSITSITKSARATDQLLTTVSWLKPYVFIEGIWGTLFSPGKSIFLYSPILIILIIFWHKLNFRKYKAEIISGLTLFFTYFYFIATLLGNEDFLLWHGDSSFGNRYMLATLPFLLIFVSLIYLKLNKKIKYLVFYPILFISILVQIVGVTQPYQIRFAGLAGNFKLNGRIFDISEYGNIIPRYSPLLSMSKKLARKVLDLKVSLNRDRNQISFYDGFGYPFGAGDNYWRSMEEYSLLKVPDNSKVSLKIINHQVIQSSTYSAKLTIKNNDKEWVELLDPGESRVIELNTKSELLIFNKTFIGTSSASIPKEQVVFITQVWINDQYQNLNTIDYPYVSPISKSILNIDYEYWGNKQKDPWSIWYMHSGVYEKTFDFWWLRPLQYWDLPKNFFIALFLINMGSIGYFGFKVLKYKSEDVK